MNDLLIWSEEARRVKDDIHLSGVDDDVPSLCEECQKEGQVEDKVRSVLCTLVLTGHPKGSCICGSRAQESSLFLIHHVDCY